METPSLTLFKTVCSLVVVLDATANAQMVSSTISTMIRNSALVITIGNDSYAYVTLDSRRPFEAGSVVYEVKSHALESNLHLTHVLISPVNGYFDVDELKGSVRTRIDLRSAEEREVKLVIKVSDTKGNSIDFNLIIFIVLNKRPNIENLPDVKFINENVEAVYTIINLKTNTDLHNETTKLIWTLKPPGDLERHKFQLDTQTGTFKLIEPLDFEKTQRYTVTFVLSDGFLDSRDGDLTINVIDVNEPPYFEEVAYYCSIDESDAGTSTCKIEVKVGDPDGDRIVFIGFKDSDRHFRYDRTTSLVTLSEYDLEVQPTDKLTYHLVARDEFGNETKFGVPVHITVRDVNDNTCEIPSTPPVTLSQNEKLPKTLFTFPTKDKDKTSPNNDVFYDIIQSVPNEANTYFDVDTNGKVTYIERIPEENNGKTYKLVVRCRDRGIPQRSAEGTILVFYQLSTTTTTTTTTATPPTTAAAATSTDPFDNPAFVAMFAIFMIALIIALLVGLYFLLRYCGSFRYCFGIGPTAKKTQVIDISEYSNQSIVNYPPVRTNMAYNDDYWKNGDNYETGTGNAITSSSRAINGGFKRLALPAPAVSRGFNF